MQFGCSAARAWVYSAVTLNAPVLVKDLPLLVDRLSLAPMSVLALEGWQLNATSRPASKRGKRGREVEVMRGASNFRVLVVARSREMLLVPRWVNVREGCELGWQT